MSKKSKKIIVCRCEDVALDDVEKAINEGYTDLEEIKRLLRCGMGPCQGRTCMRLTAKILSHKIDRPMGEIRFSTIRSPIRPTPLALFTTKKPKEQSG